MGICICLAIANGLSLVSGSVVVTGSSGAPSGTGDLVTAPGLNIGTINPGDTAVITYQVQVDYIAGPTPFVNDTSVTYTDPNAKVGEATATDSSPVEIISPDFGGPLGDGFNKTASEIYAIPGDIVVYTVTITNSGNVDANNVIFIDTLPDGLTFVDGTIYVNGSNWPLANPVDGIDLCCIDSMQTFVVTFEVLVGENPAVSPLSNISTVDYTYTTDPLNPDGNSASANSIPSDMDYVDLIINTELTANKTSAIVGETVTFKITVDNLGTVDATDITIQDLLPSSLDFVEGSVIINGVPQDPSVSPITGITLAELLAGDSTIITFEAVVLNTPQNPIQTQASINFDFIPLLGADPVNRTETSNVLDLPRLVAHMTLNKSINDTIVLIGETITFEISILNDGEFDVTDVILTDILDSHLEYLGNVTIDGTASSENIVTEAYIGDMTMGTEVIVTFDCKVLSKPASGIITNSATAQFTYSNEVGGF